MHATESYIKKTLDIISLTACEVVVDLTDGDDPGFITSFDAYPLLYAPRLAKSLSWKWLAHTTNDLGYDVGIDPKINSNHFFFRSSSLGKWNMEVVLPPHIKHERACSAMISIPKSPPSRSC